MQITKEHIYVQTLTMQVTIHASHAQQRVRTTCICPNTHTKEY